MSRPRSVPATPHGDALPSPGTRGPGTRIGINLLYLIPGVVGGTELYATSLLRALGALDEHNEYVLFVNREGAEFPLWDGPNFRRVVCRVQATRRAARYAWEQAVLPLQLAAHRIRVVHSLGYVGPLLAPCAHAVTIHDLNYLYHAGSMRPARRQLLGGFVTQSARRADHILTVSEFSRQDIAHRLRVPLERITVTHNAGRDDPPDFGTLADVARARYGVDAPYLLAFSSQSTHKNIAALVHAFVAIADVIPHTLLLVGHAPPGVELAADARRAGLAARVVTTGYVPDAHVLPLLRGAELFVFPSRYEGFGIPILDAQKAGVPVACSRVAALPEVAGDGAEYFDPGDVTEMAAVLVRCLNDPSLRAQLRERGARNVTRFSWADTARTTLAVYERLAARGRVVNW